MTSLPATASARWKDHSDLVRVTSGPAMTGTRDEETLAGVDRDTPWYDVRRIEAPRVATNVRSFLIERFPVMCTQYATFLNDVGAAFAGGHAWIGDVCVAADVPSWLEGRAPGERVHGVGVAYNAARSWVSAPGSEGLPVTLVTWFGAAAYAAHYGARLPTEVEWEKAARGPDGLRFPWGNEYVTGIANLSDYWAGHPVTTQAEWDADFFKNGAGPAWLASRPNAPGAFPKGVSPYGCEDMIGNVAEWCFDVYDASSEGGRADFRAVRGAGRYGYTAIARCATRRRRAPESISENLGFRIAVDEPVAEDDNEGR